jgi:catechol 2,3-dioxygenase-like lactoylglutathione lyase family enzyme
MSNRPEITGILETALYVGDLDRSGDFYQRVFGFHTIVRQEDRLHAMRVSDNQILLLFKRGRCREPLNLPNGRIPSHDGNGTLHFAFAIDKDQVQPWRDWLMELNITISSEVEFSEGRRSIYFRDPDDHLVELATPGIWDIYEEMAG